MVLSSVFLLSESPFKRVTDDGVLDLAFKFSHNQVSIFIMFIERVLKPLDSQCDCQKTFTLEYLLKHFFCAPVRPLSNMVRLYGILILQVNLSSLKRYSDDFCGSLVICCSSHLNHMIIPLCLIYFLIENLSFLASFLQIVIYSIE